MTDAPYNQQLRQEISRTILETLREGEALYNQAGEQIGVRQPSAAYVGQAIKWCQDCERFDGLTDKPATRDELMSLLQTGHAAGGSLPDDDPENE